jgi:hypothetical protein
MLPKRVEIFMDVEAAATVYSFGTGHVPAIQHLPVVRKRDERHCINLQECIFYGTLYTLEFRVNIGRCRLYSKPKILVTF